MTARDDYPLIQPINSEQVVQHLAMCDEIDRLRAEAEVAKAFYDLTVAQRDLAWHELQQRKDLDGWNVHGR